MDTPAAQGAVHEHAGDGHRPWTRRRWAPSMDTPAAQGAVGMSLRHCVSILDSVLSFSACPSHYLRRTC